MTFRYASLVRAELFRMARQRSNWLLPLAPLAGLIVLAALTATSQGLTDTRGKTVLSLARDLTDTASVVLAMTLGAPVLLVAARAAAHDHHYGTVRLLVGGGAGRGRLVLAKLTAAGAIALAALVLGSAGAAAAVLIGSPSLAGNLTSLPRTYSRELLLDLCGVAVSLGCCAVLGTFTSTVSRSLAAGLTAAMVWLPTEQALTAVLAFLSGITHVEVLARATGWLLAPNLDHLIQALQPWRSTVEIGARPIGAGSSPVGPVGAEQGLIVIGAWAAAFVLASLVSAVARVDVSE